MTGHSEGSIVRELQDKSNQPVDYSVVRGRRKTMAVHVRHQAVEVRVPFFVSQTQIQDFVYTHIPWILRKLEHKAAQDSQRPDLCDGGTVYYPASTLDSRHVGTRGNH